ncbi:hypothetical protein WICMUC_000840 [Wickerhamomyces mucosus]|uniref:Major facilitator superfamily (MFS) profile domain-containing protein n=1 Tax=Wickerhamomyces mucosus TaxID=1378264 RepID=A0A9P8THC0_9ASCO|nr:hypothetical protein WICMUC_000840 [Wickerhamomyces mucosus]
MSGVTQDKRESHEEFINDIENESPEKPLIIEVPDGGYGWVVCFGVLLFNISTWASNSAYAVYLAHYLDNDVFEGATTLDFAAVGGIAFGCGLLFSNVILWVARLTSVRFAVALGAVFQFSGLILAAFSKKIWQIYLTQGVLIGFGLAFIIIPSNSLMSQWFREKRALTQAITVTGSGFGGIMFNLAIQKIIQNISLKWALIIQAIICTVCTVTGIILIRTRDEHIKPVFKFWDFKIMKTSPFIIVSFYLGFAILGYVVLLYNLSDFTVSLGYSESQGSIVTCMISVGIILGRPTVGRLSDRFGPTTVGIFCHILVGIFNLAIWLPARNLSTAIGFAIVQGGLMGTIWVVLPPITSRLFGLKRISLVLSMFYTIIGVFAIVSPVIGIKLRTSAPQGTYSPTQYRDPAIYCGCVYLGAALLLWVIRAYLLSRDEVAEKTESHEDNDELHIKVSFTQILSKLFARSPHRKV